MTFGITRLATLKFETKLQKCIRMGITIFKKFIWGGISSDIRSRVAVKLNFRPYIRRYTSPNENFEYIYPLNVQRIYYIRIRFACTYTHTVLRHDRPSCVRLRYLELSSIIQQALRVKHDCPITMSYLKL